MRWSDNSAGSETPRRFRDWNRRLHYYLGLYLLFFVWLFALTGLLLNHGSWKFAEFWTNRKTAVTEEDIGTIESAARVEMARQIMRRIGVTGEIQWLPATAAAKTFDFRVTRPGWQYEIKGDLGAGRARIERTELNAWGVARLLHTFTGVRANDPANARDWVLTTLWALSMDAVAAGLIVMTVTGVIAWLQSGAHRAAGAVALGTGMAVCVWFLADLG